MSDGFIFLWAVFAALALVGICYTTWNNTPERKENRQRINDYQIRTNYHGGKWR